VRQQGAALRCDHGRRAERTIRPAFAPRFRATRLVPGLIGIQAGQRRIQARFSAPSGLARLLREQRKPEGRRRCRVPASACRLLSNEA